MVLVGIEVYVLYAERLIDLYWTPTSRYRSPVVNVLHV